MRPAKPNTDSLGIAWKATPAGRDPLEERVCWFTKDWGLDPYTGPKNPIKKPQVLSNPEPPTPIGVSLTRRGKDW